ncbi:tRNA (N(6)-L-threonylcarbamoyladenosine(37)-C(2))-methylthiotransferase MtaB [Alphaproteobacteria bacterium LMG 31809]|uniref:tRNA (N(6)-L-threonylcarbamoyladenosine(37)-C(2))-methylthiotransferase n=2 Tax=Govanella unica TaxID=2975056 RepID=A0A9X3Z618_9PROT|nr:tRNA (N(6)-L-threonylcarbamoyladenosine(37)-C(2))-methylthiotransferase MtaB [Govania unica]
MPAPKVVTFGCRLNTYESAVMEKHATAAGLDDAIIFNTCAVTAEATRQARQAIRKARRENPAARIIVTGCAAQTEPEIFAAMTEVDQVIGNTEKLDAKSYMAFGMGESERVIVNDIMSVTETASHLVDGFGDRARAFVQVQNGCNHRCTFCIIPFGRGNSRSVPMGEVVREVQALVARGYREVVLSGVDITSFGADLPGTPTLGTLCRKILDLVPDLPRLRLSSIDSIEVEPALMDLIIHEPRLMPHLHLSLQAGDNMILKRMKRRHNREQAIEFCQTVKAARPEIAFGADIIAGFPTETEHMFAQSLALVTECDLTYLHVFPYSERHGTPAAKMPQVEKAVRKERAARLRALGDQQLDRFLDREIGRLAHVLIERADPDGTVIGHAANFAPVKIAADLAPGTLISARLTSRAGTTLLGTIETLND